MASSANNTAGIIDTLYRAHHGWLTTWLRKKMICPHHAADLSHDTFIRLLSLPEIPNLREPRAYLLVTANRLMINLNRRHRVETEVLQCVATLTCNLSDQDIAHASAVRQLLERVLYMLIDELDERSRNAFLMSHVDGMTYAEIAHAMNISESRVKQHLVKALAYCHQRLYQFKAGLYD
ncbi:MAG: sigma-70 family RNA polymerase sigma factor [Nitrosomonas sp.]|nr:sigma-70 family RNA polymerase sigma factor [Nitrosomonas sp.]MCW5607378.1 sigma-70 family RNA polymerase sigma factor [Nitrosomonas sp.]